MTDIFKDVAKSAKHDGIPGEQFHYARVAFDWDYPIASIAEKCRDPEQYWSLDKTLLAVYVISADDKPYSKIGIAEHPHDRCAGLQTANWDRLHLRFNLWVWDGMARAVEQKSLSLARERGIEVRGEWVLLLPEDAFMLVLSAARELAVDAGSREAIALTSEQISQCRAQSRRSIELRKTQEKFARLGY